MSLELEPSADFNWQQVSWGGPDQPRTTRCSYCDAPFPELGTEEEEAFVPLILWNHDGWCAEFCEECMQRYWGLRW